MVFRNKLHCNSSMSDHFCSEIDATTRIPLDKSKSMTQEAKTGCSRPTLPRFLTSMGPFRKRVRRHPCDDTSTASTADSEASEIYPKNIVKVALTITKTNTQNNSIRTKNRKCVSFARNAKARFIQCRKEITDEEKQAAWFCREEFDQITKSCCKQVNKIEGGEILKDLKYCGRGLESYTVSSALSKKKNRRAAFDAVLDGQDALLDDEQIAKDYHNVSSSCQLWARAMAQRDRIEAEAYLFDTEDGS